MIGLGKWKMDVNIPFLKVEPILTIAEKDGKYEFSVDAQGFGITPQVNLTEVTEENGNTLRIKAQVPMLNVGDVSGVLTFEGTFCKGEAEVPMLGKMTVKGERVG